MGNAVATRKTPSGIEVEYQHLAFVLGENRALAVGELPAHFGERCRSRRGHRISGPSWRVGDDGRWLLGGYIVAVARRQYDRAAKGDYWKKKLTRHRRPLSSH